MRSGVPFTPPLLIWRSEERPLMQSAHPLIDAFGRPIPIPAPLQLEPTIPFPYHDVDGDASDEDGPPLSFTASEWEKFGQGLEKIIRWIYQDPGHYNFEGIQIRALIVAWLVVDELQPLTLTQLARMYGRDKQSFGRWVEHWKESFPEIRNCHMQVE